MFLEDGKRYRLWLQKRPPLSKKGTDDPGGVLTGRVIFTARARSCSRSARRWNTSARKKSSGGEAPFPTRN